MINAQAVNLDILDVCLSKHVDDLDLSEFQVIALAPSEWPLNMISPFLCRSYGRVLHAEREGKIVKNISAWQNLEVRGSLLLQVHVSHVW